MPQRLYTIRRGQRSQDIVEAAGSVVATDTMTLNIDFTNMTHGEAHEMIDRLRERIFERPWPPA